MFLRSKYRCTSSSRPFAERTIDGTSSRNVENWSAIGLASSVPTKASVAKNPT